MARQTADSSRYTWPIIAVVIVVLTVVILLVAKSASNQKSASSSTSDGVASADLMSKVSTIPAATFDTVAAGGITTFPRSISAPALTDSSKPEIVYVGAEYCPYCAAQRWGMVVALSRFGSFTNLGLSHSATADVYPNTATFSFHGASYTSDYLSFIGREIQSNKANGNSYAPLDTLSTDLQSLFSTYNAAPYVDAQSAGSIPFIDFGGKYLLNGSSYSPQLLAGKSADDIAATLSNPNDPIAQAILGEANSFTAAFCSLTGDQPSTVCSSSVIQGLKASLNAHE